MRTPSMTSPRRYTNEERQVAFAPTLEVGPAAASRELGAAKGTWCSWDAVAEARPALPASWHPACKPTPAARAAGLDEKSHFR